ncbi:P-loop NTPase fold protein [Citrobacter amalonaticus]|uniref:P-loop NTPase fold protein n=1 Tax=Citrobacter amalonaticus TaxID=35703 RepID=UPI00300CFCCF
MTLESTKTQLEQLLADKDNKVISLSGKWGTGKSYMWEQIKSSSGDDMVKGALYVSLFGLSGIEQVKMKLIQSAVPAIEANPGFWDSAKKTVASSVKVLEGFHKGFGALNDLGLIFAPAMLRKKLIVIDDIERKHEKLNIDELLGFIDEFTQQYECRFMLILNTDQLAQRIVWDTLREKVIDQELKLTTSAYEAFDIAISLTPSDYSEHIKKSAVSCKLTNIRIIRKIIKVINYVLGGRRELTDTVLARVIPSTVLLSAIHYKGIDDSPDLDFILSHNAMHDILGVEKDSAEKELTTESKKQQSRWKLLLNETGVTTCDEYEFLIVEFLQSGMFDVSQVAKIIDRYVRESDEMNANYEFHIFRDRFIWDHTLSETQLRDMATKISNRAYLLSAQTVSSYCEILSELSDCQDIIHSVLTQWISKFQQSNNTEDIKYFNLVRHSLHLHPRIIDVFEKQKHSIQANTSIYDACQYVAEHSAWGSRQTIAFKSATEEDIESIIKTREYSEMRSFVLLMLDFCIHRKTYEEHFGSGLDKFLQVCRNITRDPNSGRLGKLIRNLFSEKEYKDLLGDVTQIPTDPT